jgi:hypothetical protein
LGVEGAGRIGDYSSAAPTSANQNSPIGAAFFIFNPVVLPKKRTVLGGVILRIVCLGMESLQRPE